MTDKDSRLGSTQPVGLDPEQGVKEVRLVPPRGWDSPRQMVTPDSFDFEYKPSDAPRRWSDPMDLELTYYLSGPMRGYPDHNWPAFTHAAKVLRNTGITIVSPHEVTPDSNLNVPENYPLEYLRRDIVEMVSKCRGLILMKGWPESRGARVELELALSLEWPIWYYHEFQLTFMSKS